MEDHTAAQHFSHVAPIVLSCYQATSELTLGFLLINDFKKNAKYSKHRFLLHLEERKRKKTEACDSTWVRKLDHRALISFKQRLSDVHTEAWGIFLGRPLHECQANTQTIRSGSRCFTTMPLPLELCVKVCSVQQWIYVHAGRQDKSHMAFHEAAVEDSCCRLTRLFLFGFRRD